MGAGRATAVQQLDNLGLIQTFVFFPCLVSASISWSQRHQQYVFNLAGSPLVGFSENLLKVTTPVSMFVFGHKKQFPALGPVLIWSGIKQNKKRNCKIRNRRKCTIYQRILTYPAGKEQNSTYRQLPYLYLNLIFVFVFVFCADVQLQDDGKGSASTSYSCNLSLKKVENGQFPNFKGQNPGDGEREGGRCKCKCNIQIKFLSKYNVAQSETRDNFFFLI